MNKNNSRQISVLFFVVALMMVSYQNCSQETGSQIGSTKKSSSTPTPTGDEPYVELLVNGKSAITSVSAGQSLTFSFSSFGLENLSGHYWVTDYSNKPVPEKAECVAAGGYGPDSAALRQGVSAPLNPMGTKPWVLERLAQGINKDDQYLDPAQLQPCQTGLVYHVVIFGEKESGEVIFSKVTVSTVE